MNTNDLLLLFRLLAAHMTGEWIFQAEVWQKIKSSGKFFSRQQLLQAGVMAILGYLLAAQWLAFWLPPALFCIRLAVGYYTYKGKKPVLFMILKQILYLVLLVGLWLLLTKTGIKMVFSYLHPVISHTRTWLLLLSYMAVMGPIGILIGKITEPWRKELDLTRIKGLEKAGLWMGRLERMLILTFVLVDQYQAIGLLIAAKSILRFSEIKSSKDRKEAEYILIGTMLSFAFGISMGIAVSWLFNKI